LFRFQRSGLMVFLALTFAIAIVGFELLSALVHIAGAVESLLSRTGEHDRHSRRSGASGKR
jgi:hypothetical protein